MAQPVMPGEGPGAFRRFVLPVLFVLGLFAALWLRRPETEPANHLWTITGPTMGTSFTIKVAPGDPDDEALEKRTTDAIQAALKDVNQKMSTYQPDSELSTFNKTPSTEPVTVSEDLHKVMAESLRISTLSGGAFDVTVGPLVNAWGFGPKDMGTPPGPKELDTLAPKIGYQRLSLAGDKGARTLKKAHPEMYVDLSAIAKGFGVDQVARSLDGLGHEHYMVEVGGEVRAKGEKSKGQPWRIGIEKPDAKLQAVQEVVELHNLSMATSGNYRNFYEKDGKRLSHTINPTTGQPVEHRLASVSVLHQDCMTADAWATTLNVLGEEKGFALAAEQKLAAFLLIKQADGTFIEKTTPAFETLRKLKTSDTP